MDARAQVQVGFGAQVSDSSSSAVAPLHSFAQLASHPAVYSTCFAEIIPIHINPEYFPNEIPFASMANPIQPVPAQSGQRRGRPTKAQDAKKPESVPKPKEQTKETQDREIQKKRADYRAYWLSNTKLPIEDSVLHSRVGIRRLGPPRSSAVAIAHPTLLWVGSAPNVEKTAKPLCSSAGQRIEPDGALLSYLFLQTFAPYLALPRYDINQFHSSLVSEYLEPVFAKTLIALYRFLEPDLILASDGFIQQLDREEQQFLQTYGKNAYTSRSGLQQAVEKLKSDLLFFRHLFESAPVTERTIWSLIIHAASFVSGPALVEIKEDLFFAEDLDLRGVDLETSWVIDEALDYKDFKETSPAARGRVLKTLVDKLLDTAIIKRILDINSEVRVRIQAEMVQLSKNEQRLSSRIVNAKRVIEGGSDGREDDLRKQIDADTAHRARLVVLKAAVEEFLLVQPHSSAHIGLDREGNEYFSYPYAPNTVLVWLKKQHSIGSYVGEKALERLIDSLDSRGIREEALRREVLSIKSEEEVRIASSKLPDHDLWAFLEKDFMSTGGDQTSMQIEDQPADEAPDRESFSFLRQTLSVAREALSQSLDVWMGDTEDSMELGDIPDLAKRISNILADPQAELAGQFSALENRQIPSPSAFADFVERLAETFINDSTERQVLVKVAAGRNASVVSEEVECSLCGKKCVNSVLLDVHMKKWCKQKNASGEGQAEGGDENTANAPQTSWVQAVESVPMPFPPLSQAKQLNSSVAGTGSGPFVCDACSKEFGTQSALSLHIRKWCKGALESAAKTKPAQTEADANVTDGPPFFCPHCKREMATLNGLTVHLGRWCPEKSYGATVDLVTGWSDTEDMAKSEPVKAEVAYPENQTFDKPTPPESTEDLFAEEIVPKVSESSVALALSWILWRAQ